MCGENQAVVMEATPRTNRLKSRAEQRIAAPVKVVTIHEVGLDGFWIHRLLEANGVESHVVDPASIAVPRRHRRAGENI